MKITSLGGIGYDSNIYLVEDDINVLIDCGTNYHTQHTIEEIERRVPLDSIERIILTHRHYDHTGGAKTLQERTGAETFCHELDAKCLVVGDSVSTGARNFGDDMEPIQVTDIKRGEILSFGEMEMIVIHTPGHSVGSVCLFDPNKRILFSGDTVFADGGVGRWDLVTGNFEELVASVDLLTTLEVDALYPGHGNHTETGGAARIERSMMNLTMYTPDQLMLRKLHQENPLRFMDGEDLIELIQKRKDGMVKDLSHSFELEEDD